MISHTVCLSRHVGHGSYANIETDSSLLPLSHDGSFSSKAMPLFIVMLSYPTTGQEHRAVEQETPKLRKSLSLLNSPPSGHQ